MARARMAGGSIVAALAWLAVPGAALAQPGYECRYEREGDFGKVSAQFEVPREGQPSEWPYLQWEAPDGPIKEPHVGAGFFRTADGRYRIENGYASISWHVWAPDRRPLTLSLQLRTRPEPPRYSRAALAGEFRRSGGPFGLTVDWSDLAAFARVARELHLVALDRRYRLVATAPLDPALVTRAEPHIVEAFRELEAMIADPEPNCTFLEDLRSNDIVVTTPR